MKCLAEIISLNRLGGQPCGPAGSHRVSSFPAPRSTISTICTGQLRTCDCNSEFVFQRPTTKPYPQKIPSSAMSARAYTAPAERMADLLLRKQGSHIGSPWSNHKVWPGRNEDRLCLDSAPLSSLLMSKPFPTMALIIDFLIQHILTQRQGSVYARVRTPHESLPATTFSHNYSQI